MGIGPEKGWEPLLYHIESLAPDRARLLRNFSSLESSIVTTVTEIDVVTSCGWH